MIRVGLAGAGPWAQMFTAPLIDVAPQLTLSAVWARRREAAVAFAGQHGANAATSFEALMEQCDAVAFNVPPGVQASLAVQAAKAGKHLLLEKPLGMTVSDADAIAAAADAAGVASHVMLTYRYAPQVRSFLDDVGRARVEYVRTSFVGGGAKDGPFATPWRGEARAVLFDLGPHSLDLAEAVAGPIRTVMAAETGNVVSVTTAHHDGAIGHVALSGATPNAAGRLEAECLTDGGQYVLSDPTPRQPTQLHLDIAAEFASAIELGRRSSFDVHRGVELQRVIAAVEESIQTGRVVAV